MAGPPPAVNFGAAPTATAPSQSGLFGTSDDIFNQQVPVAINSRNVGSLQMGGVPTQSVGDVLKSFYAFDPNTLIQLQQQMFNAGYYGNTPQSQIAFGAHDDASYAAFLKLVSQAAREGHPVGDVLSEMSTANKSAGATGAPRVGVTGGGNKFVLDLTNPDDVATVTDSIAHTLLGRGATAAEKAKVTAAVQGPELQDFGARNAAAEAQSLNQFHAQQQARDIAQGQGGTTIDGAQGATGDVSQVKATITQVANELGVPANLALAIAQEESGFNPTASGDGGHSIGVFQLNDAGGEGSGMSVAARQDVATNARIALTEVAAVMKRMPGATAGQVAAAAQRPADRVGYANAINSIITGGGGSNIVTPGAAGSSSPAGQDVFVPGTSTVLTGAPSPAGAATAVLQQQDPSEITDFRFVQGLQGLTAALHAGAQDAGATRGVAP